MCGWFVEVDFLALCLGGGITRVGDLAVGGQFDVVEC